MTLGQAKDQAIEGWAAIQSRVRRGTAGVLGGRAELLHHVRRLGHKTQGLGFGGLSQAQREQDVDHSEMDEASRIGPTRLLRPSASVSCS